MSELIGIARFRFHPVKVEEYKRLSAQAMDIVRAKESGTLEYSVFFNADESVLTDLASFLQLEPDATWLDDSLSVYRLPRPYEIETDVLDHYRREIDRRFSDEPALQYGSR